MCRSTLTSSSSAMTTPTSGTCAPGKRQGMHVPLCRQRGSASGCQPMGAREGCGGLKMCLHVFVFRSASICCRQWNFHKASKMLRATLEWWEGVFWRMQSPAAWLPSMHVRCFAGTYGLTVTPERVLGCCVCNEASAALHASIRYVRIGAAVLDAYRIDMQPTPRWKGSTCSVGASACKYARNC